MVVVVEMGVVGVVLDVSDRFVVECWLVVSVL